MRFCHVAPPAEAAALAELLLGLGLDERDLGFDAADGFSGAVFPVAEAASAGSGEVSWVEIWPAGEGFEPSTMLQLVVDDADAVAALARQRGLQPDGPTDDHGERIYFLAGPGGLAISFQSTLP